jgi:hypothetical protein
LEIKTQNHLLNIIGSCKDQNPCFSLFLGAGASVTSNVRPVSSLLDEWRLAYRRINGSSGKLTEYLGKSNEYGFLFENLYDTPSQRRMFIESCIKHSSPSFGYIYLVNLLHHSVFNTIFTTNFDDLLNDACYSFHSEVRPVVCAHDSSVKNLRVVERRPKILKLHGDFLFDSIKNTPDETKQLEQNMSDKFEQFAREYGMIVIGYAGNDESVMSSLEKLLETGDKFPHGVYWCMHKQAKPNERVESLTKHKNFHLVAIEGFDELMAEIHNLMNLSLQPEVSDPFAALVGRLNKLIRRLNLPKTKPAHQLMEREVARLGDKIIATFMQNELDQPVEQIIEKLHGPESQEHNLTEYGSLIPFGFLAQIFIRKGDFSKAHNCVAFDLHTNMSPDCLETAYEIMRLKWNDALAELILDKISSLPSTQDISSYNFNDRAIDCIHAEKLDHAVKLLQLERSRGHKGVVSEMINIINSAQIFRHAGLDLPENLSDVCRHIQADDNIDLLLKLGASIVLQDWKTAEKIIQDDVIGDIVLFDELCAWPLFNLLHPHIADEELKKRMGQRLTAYKRGPIRGPYIRHMPGDTIRGLAETKKIISKVASDPLADFIFEESNQKTKIN